MDTNEVVAGYLSGRLSFGEFHEVIDAHAYPDSKRSGDEIGLMVSDLIAEFDADEFDAGMFRDALSRLLLDRQAPTHGSSAITVAQLSSAALEGNQTLQPA